MRVGTVVRALRGRRVVVALGSALAVGIAVPAATGTSGAKGLCAPLSPPRTPLPKSLHVPLSNYGFELSPNAQAHHALCSVGLSSPTDGYLYTVEWDVFPSRALAVSDLDAVSPTEIYATISKSGAARGFPSPNYELTGTGKSSGKPVTDVTFVDGPAIVSAFIYSKGAFSQSLALAHWASRDLSVLSKAK